MGKMMGESSDREVMGLQGEGSNPEAPKWKTISDLDRKSVFILGDP
jgi:hypothetical protein